MIVSIHAVQNIQPIKWKWYRYRKGTSIRQAPVFGAASEHCGKTHGSLLSGWMNYNYTACCWFPMSSNILILPSQFWQIRFESFWLHCSKCRILVLLRYISCVDIRLCFHHEDLRNQELIWVSVVFLQTHTVQISQWTYLYSLDACSQTFLNLIDFQRFVDCHCPDFL